VRVGTGQYKGRQRLTLWDVDKWHGVRRFEGHEDPVVRAAFSPDGRRALSGTLGGDVYAWDVKTGKQLSHYSPQVGLTNRINRPEPDGSAKSLDFSPDGRHGLWAGGYINYQLRLFDVEPGRERKAFVPKPRSREYVVRAVFSRDGRSILAVNSNGYLRVWDIAKATSSAPLKISDTVLTSVAFSPDRRLALAGSHGGALSLWRIEGVQQGTPHVKELVVLQETYPLEQRVNEHGQGIAGIAQVALSLDLRYAATAEHNRTVRVWKLAPNK
jgi:WD40 repeat protein